MDDTDKMRLRVKPVLENLAKEEVTHEMYEVVRDCQSKFLRMGITPNDLKELLELKQKVTFLPEACAYSLSRPGRGDYILANFDSPHVTPVDKNEERFMAALFSYYQMRDDYKHKMCKLSTIAKGHLERMREETSYQLGKKHEVGLLTDILLDRDIDGYHYHTADEQKRFLEKFDLYDAYHLDDGKMTLKLKAGEMLESEGIMEKGETERRMTEAGVSVSKLKDGLQRYKIDTLRVNRVVIRTEYASGSAYISCYVDEDYQHVRKMSARDVALLAKLKNETGMAVKYFADVLDKNRRENRMIADEKTLERKSVPYVDRLLDIYRNGMNEQDVMLSKASKSQETDAFWWDNRLLGIEQYSVEKQKEYAFGALTDYINDLVPGLLTDEEVVKLVGTEPAFAARGRELENNFLELPEPFFPLIEQCGKYDRKMIDYAKVLREIGRATPTTAYNSMDYFLDHRLRREFDLEGAEDDYGRPIASYYYPNSYMKNPAEKFPANLLNEMQWSALANKNKGEAASFIPECAFRKNRITGVQVYASGNGDLNIRCMVDGEQQGSKRLSAEDALRYQDERTDLNEMAAEYYTEAFAKDEAREVALRR